MDHWQIGRLYVKILNKSFLKPLRRPESGHIFHRGHGLEVVCSKEKSPFTTKSENMACRPEEGLLRGLPPTSRHLPHRPLICLVSLDPVDPEILEHLAAALTHLFSLPVRILPPRPLPSHTLHVVRNQHHSTQLLEYLLNSPERADCPDHEEPFRILGITAVDLYIPIFTFVFGEAQLEGQAAIISTFRPRGGGDSEVKPPREVFLSRLIKLSLHELGHTFGISHCRREGCPMGFAPNLEKLDQKNLEFCEYCQILLADYYTRNGL